MNVSVFDDRVTVDHDLEAGKYDQCHACRMPILEEDKEREEYTKGGELSSLL